MLLVNENETSFLGSTQLPVENRIVWKPHGDQIKIFAVGGPAEWASSAPFPPELVQTNLISASVENPLIAQKLWNHFLFYVYFKSNQGFFSSLKCLITGISVQLNIKDDALYTDVYNAIIKSKPFRIKIKQNKT